MSDYLYGNTRLRAMKSRLLSADTLLSLTNSVSIDDLLLQLSRGVYREEIALVSAQYSGLEIFSHFFRLQQENTIKKLHTFYTGKIKELIERVLWHYEVFNIKTILRGQTVQEDASLISSTLIRTGLVPEAVLTSLVGAQDLWQVINRVFSFGLPYAQGLKTQEAQSGFSLIKLETFLEQWYFDFAQHALPHQVPGKEQFLKALNFEADLINLILGLRFISGQDQDWAVFKDLIVPLGAINLRQLQDFVHSADLNTAIQELTQTPFRQRLLAAVNTYTQYQNLTDIEKALRIFRLNWYKKLADEDPLGLGVPLGFLVLKQNEQRNLSWIGRGLYFGLPAETIRNNLELAG